MYAASIVKDISEAEDITASAFMEVWNRRDAWESERHVIDSLFIMTRNRCLDRIRRKYRFQKYIDLEKHESALFPEIKSEIINYIFKEINKLSDPLQKKVMYLSYLDGYKIPEIAKITKKPIKTIYEKKEQALNRLKKIFTPLNHLRYD